MPVPDVAVARAALTQPDLTAVRDYLEANSALPGPRANLELLALAGDVLTVEHAAALRKEASEYLRCCGVIRLGRQYLDDPGARQAVTAELTRFAADDSWRVREAVAMAVQRIGDAALDRAQELVAAWVRHADPLVRRAAMAAICEPRLLLTPEAAAFAVQTCREATDSIVALPPERRREASVRTLRQALGYGWSVAVAANPAAGLPEFLALGGDPDVDWIVGENRKKARLRRLLPG